jgi:hypothetical protein
MYTKSANLAQMDALWRAYVNSDPDLHRLEHRKRDIAHRRIWVAHAKRVRREAGREIVKTLAHFAAVVTICFVCVAVFLFMVFFC